MKNLLLSLICSMISIVGVAQTDTIFVNNERIVCFVKEITPDAVKFVYPEEEVLNSVYKNTIQKIVFKSGRVQTFAEATSYKKVVGVEDFENVSITQVESEVKGLFKIGEVSSKAKGTTTLSNQERVKERAYRKMKMVAAMMGGNVVYITNQRTQSNNMGTEYQAGSSAEANLSGVAYTNILPSYDGFINAIGDKRSFNSVVEIKLWSSASDIKTNPVQGMLLVNNITNDNGMIILEGSFAGHPKIKRFRVTAFGEGFFNVFYEDKSSVYSLKVRI